MRHSRFKRYGCIACLAVLGSILVAVLNGSWARTPAIRNPDGPDSATSVASLEWIELGGYRQALLIRGIDRRNPILLFLHGGPGMPAMYLAHAFQRPLERHFTVVHWDRRGAGKSFRPTLPAEALKVSELLADAEELVLELRQRFGQDKVYLVGHSWGSYLGTLLVLKRPEFFRAYVGVGQVVDEDAAVKLQAEFIRREAERRGDDEAVEALQGQGLAAHEEWLFRYGGELAKHTSFMPFVLTGLRAPEYTLLDVGRVAQGSSFSSKNMTYDVIQGPLRDHAASYPVPIYLFTGRHDWTTPYPLIAEFFEEIEAPRKELVWFEESAHFPFFEEPEKFAEEMLRVRRDSEVHP